MLALLIVVCVLCLLPPGPSGVSGQQPKPKPPKTAAELRTEGDEAFARNSFSNAIRAYEAAAKLGLKDDARMVLRLAISYNEVGDFEVALAVADYAIKLDPKSADAHYERGYAQKGLGDKEAMGTPAEKQLYDAAIASHREAIRLNPSLGRAFQGLGETLYAAGADVEAAAAYAEAVRLIPDDAELRVSLGNILSSLTGRDKDAAVHFAEAVRLDPEDYQAATSLARAYRLLGRLPEALAQLRLALRIKPDYAMAHAGLALVFAGQGNHAGAVDEYRITGGLDKALGETLVPLLEKAGMNPRSAGGTKPPAAACPELRVDGPDSVFSGESITFRAQLIGATLPGTPVFNWRVSAASIESGQGTATVTLNTGGVSGETVTAVIEVSGFGRQCDTRSAHRTRILGRGKR